MRDVKAVERKACPKCYGKMVRRSRVNRAGNGIEKTFDLCGCGYAVDVGKKEGYWTR